ncbi:Alkanal monooxygenase beta chain [archaeon HR01]|nr:Alkanal monooxygenase beta chain [archaeon HR01]
MKFGLAYSIQSPTKEWSQAYDNVVEQTLLAERLGFDSVLISEHHLTDDGYFPSPLVVAAGLSSVTRRIRVGTAVVLVPLHHPVEVAEAAAVTDVMSRGRLILGLGLGYRPEEFNLYNVPRRERGPRLEEGTTLIRRLLSEENVTFSGRFYKVNKVTLTPRPVQRPPPIWIAAKFEPAIRRAARIGDAWFADPVTPLKVLKERNNIYLDELKRIGRDPAMLERPLWREAYVAGSDDEAWEVAKDGVLYIYGRDYFRWGHLQDEEGREVNPQNTSFEEFAETLRKRFIIRGVDGFIDEVEKYRREIGTNYFVFRIYFPGMRHDKALDAIRLIGTKIIPYFEEDKKPSGAGIP